MKAMCRAALATGLLIVAAPGSAQQPAHEAPPSERTQAPDPARLAIAERLAVRFWPDGSYGRIMRPSMIDNLMAMLPARNIEQINAIYGADSKQARRARQTLAMAGPPPTDAQLQQFADTLLADMAEANHRRDIAARTQISRVLARLHDTNQLTEWESATSAPSVQSFAASFFPMLGELVMVPEMKESMETSPEERAAFPALIRSAAARAGITVPEPDPGDIDLSAPAAADAAAAAVDAAAAAALKM